MVKNPCGFLCEEGGSLKNKKKISKEGQGSIRPDKGTALLRFSLNPTTCWKRSQVRAGSNGMEQKKWKNNKILHCKYLIIFEVKFLSYFQILARIAAATFGASGWIPIQAKTLDFGKPRDPSVGSGSLWFTCRLGLFQTHPSLLGLTVICPLLLTCLFIRIELQSFKLPGAFTLSPAGKMHSCSHLHRDSSNRTVLPVATNRPDGCYKFKYNHNLLKLPDSQ